MIIDFNSEFNLFISSLSISDPFVYTLVKNLKPKHFFLIKPYDLDSYYELELSNGVKIKCPDSLIKFVDSKIPIVYRNY